MPSKTMMETPSVSAAAAPSSVLDSLVDRLELHARQTPNKVAVSFLSSTGNEVPSISSSWTYSQLNDAANYLAHRLLDASSKSRLSPVTLSPGDRILLVYPPCSPHFLLSFLACLRAGLVAVPTYPPHPSRKESLAGFAGIARGCGACVALTNGEFAALKRINELKDAFRTKFQTNSDRDDGWPEKLAWIVTDREPLRSPPHIDALPPRPPVEASIAFLQYTSGSTSQPKGVAISHGNLAHNLTIITDDLRASPDTVVVSWLPQYHDMGLIGSLLGILYCGGSGYYMSPITFLARPMAWLEAVTQFRATHLQAPNFAFGLTARKFRSEDYFFGAAEKDGGGKKRPLDLTCLKHVINGAEPVTETSIEAFERAFRPYGLPSDPSVIYPTYGLAEHTVFVCSGGRGRLTVKRKELEEQNKVVVIPNDAEAVSDESTARLLGCGFPSRQNVDVRVVDPESKTALDEDMVGEIWVDSPSKAIGYFGNAEVTKSEFHAVLAHTAQPLSETNDSLSSPSVEYLRTGDLGFFHRGELYICGRLKDLIIVGGRNYYPQDLEATAESVSDSIRPGCSAAFSMDQELSKAPDREGEEVVMILELKDPPPKPKELQCACEKIASIVRSEVSKEFSLPLSCIVLVKAKSVPKTTSGKISRSRAKRAFISGDLAVLHRVNFKRESEYILLTNADPEPCSISDGFKPVQTITASNPVPSNIQSLDRQEIKVMLVDAISQIANIDKSSVADTSPLNTFMDSVSLAQLKGMLEGQYAVKPFSDEYLFRDTTTIKKLVEIVKVGEARDDKISSNSAGNAGTPITPTVSRGGITGALGCPPGVVCCTVM